MRGLDGLGAVPALGLRSGPSVLVSTRAEKAQDSPGPNFASAMLVQRALSSLRISLSQPAPSIQLCELRAALS